jgi:hypothetical protein
LLQCIATVREPSIKFGDFAAQLGDRAAGRVTHYAFEAQREPSGCRVAAKCRIDACMQSALMCPVGAIGDLGRSQRFLFLD